MLNRQSPESTVQKNVNDELEKQRLDLQLDKELQNTFPASDALKITRRQTDRPKRSERRSDTSAQWTRRAEGQKGETDPCPRPHV